MDIFWIRHGESTNNALADPTRRVADPPLTALGRQQASRLAGFIARGGHLEAGERETGPPLDEMHASPMRRSLQTAQPLSGALGLPTQVWVDVHEIGGMWVDGSDHEPGMDRTTMAADFPEARIPSGIGERGWWTGGQESAAAGSGRAIEVVRSLRQRAREQRPREQGARERLPRVAIVSHGDFMSAVVKAFADHLPQDGLYYDHRNTGITRFRLTDGGCRVLYVNRAAHLEGEAAT